jgi:hypothetical protein
MKTRNWTKLTRQGLRREPGQMRFTLNKEAVLSINHAAFLALRSPAALEMFYDEAEGLIGLVPTGFDAQDGCAIRNDGRGHGKYVTMKRFCTRFGITPDRTLFFRTPTFDPDGTLVLNYRQALNANSGVSELGNCGVHE